MICPHCQLPGDHPVSRTHKLLDTVYRNRRCPEGHAWWTQEVECVLPPEAKAVLAKVAQDYYHRRRESAVPEQSRAGAELAEAWR